MTNFKLTEEQKHYTNAAGDRCEVALLNGVLVAVWGGANKSFVTRHTEDGQVASGHFRVWDITAPFEGWLSNPFEGAPEWAQFAVCATYYDGDEKCFYFKSEPEKGRHIDAWLSAEIFESTKNHKYIGDWRNSLTKRGERE